jgi:hypothetical protein
LNLAVDEHRVLHDDVLSQVAIRGDVVVVRIPFFRNPRQGASNLAGVPFFVQRHVKRIQILVLTHVAPEGLTEVHRNELGFAPVFCAKVLDNTAQTSKKLRLMLLQFRHRARFADAPRERLLPLRRVIDARQSQGRKKLRIEIGPPLSFSARIVDFE